MLTRSEYDRLQGQLAVALAAGDAKNSIKAYFGIDAVAILRDIPLNLTSSDEYAAYVIDCCTKSRWSVTPSLMEKLLTRLLAAGLSAGTAELTAALDRVKQQLDPNDDLFNTLWIANDQPFFNRQQLRPLLQGFIRTNAKSLLQISGPGAGRTYTGELLDYLADKLPELHYVPVKLEKESAASYTVEALAEDMLNPMGIGVPESSSSSDAASLCRFVLRSTKQQLGLWIFLLDGFNQADLQPEVKALIRLLIVKSTESEYRRKMRLILVNYPEPFKDLLPATYHKEDIPVPSVGKNDLVNCLAQLNEKLSKNGRQIDPTGLDVIACKMLDNLPAANEKVRLRSLYDQLVALATGL